MITTERLKIYPVSNIEMQEIIKNQTIHELKKAFQEMLDGCINHPDKRQWYALWNIELKDKTLVGNLSFKGLNQDGILEIGYGIDKKYEGKGLMTEAVTAVVKWAIKQNGVKQIEAETEENNIASKRVLQKSGFVPNGKIGNEGPRYVWINNI